VVAAAIVAGSAWTSTRSGTRVVSYVHGMGDWRPRETVDVEGPHGPRKLFLWIIAE
jgi:hypothetical protein